MQSCVVDSIHTVYKNKMRVLDEEPIKFFEDFMLKARFRRVMYGE